MKLTDSQKNENLPLLEKTLKLPSSQQNNDIPSRLNSEPFHYEDLRGSKRKYHLEKKRYSYRVENKRNGCIDLKYCIIFLLICALLLFVIIISPSPSDRKEELKGVPMDSNGNFCGVGKLKDYPFLFLRNFKFPLNSVCVKECPKFDYNEILKRKSDGKFLEYDEFRMENTDFYLRPYQEYESKAFLLIKKFFVLKKIIQKLFR